MLNRLEIKNIALIDSATIEFGENLNVLSGETGSGKSVILESLNFVLGAKADKSLIRSGQDYCYALVEFDVSKNQDVKDMYSVLDFEYDDTLIISRKYSIEGKNTIKINGETANVTILRKFSQLLIDVHGQSDHYSLLSSSNQLKLIDSFGDDNFQKVKSNLKTLYDEYKTVNKNLESLGGDEHRRNIQIDLLNYQINEINKAEIYDGEKEKLLSIKQKLQYQEKISNSLNLVKSSFSEDGGVEDILSSCVKSTGAISHLSTEYENLNERLNDLYAECEDLSLLVKSLLSNNDFEEIDADYIENRLSVIKQIEKKYGSTFNEIQEFLQNAKDEKEKLENFAELFDKEQKHKLELEQQLYENYLALSSLRNNICNEFTIKVMVELKELGMKNAEFKIYSKPIPSIEEVKFNSANGVDELEFLFNANKGEPVKNLSFVISGGEMSRFMLAIKAQSAKHSQTSTFIFDEIDAGISGTVANTVAKKLYTISKNKQVIAISHLPQISVMADTNLLISKIEGEEKTTTSVKKLDENDKVIEIMRLIAGNTSSESAKKHAEELITDAKKLKNSL